MVPDSRPEVTILPLGIKSRSPRAFIDQLWFVERFCRGDSPADKVIVPPLYQLGLSLHLRS